MPRFHCPVPLATGQALSLPPGAARHVQVLRLQPGAAITLFNGEGGQWQAIVTRMGRSNVDVEIGAHEAVERENARAVHLALGMPANERMDWLVEKAAELGTASITPLAAARSVLRVSGERAQKKQAHWQGIAVAACEQCGRNRVPAVAEPQDLVRWCASQAGADGVRLVLSLEPDTVPLAQALAQAPAGPVWLLSGPEGGLAPEELQAARAAGFRPVTLGPRVLRAETAPLAALSFVALQS
jgi:16S rRNA (uracil1498-N3)-methyltransferase